jgi:hypothetical protein
VFRYLPEMPLSQVAAALERDGVPYRPGRRWTKDAVRDIWRRRRLYLGFAIRKRSLEERPGTHEPILTEEEYNAAVVAVERRSTTNSAPKRSQRVYLLRGVVFCADCGTRMTGDARTRGDQEWRYYACPVANRRVTTNAAGEPITCDNKRIPAALVEDAVLSEVAQARLPEDAIEAARAMLKERLAKPADDAAESKRRRLERALESLRKQHSGVTSATTSTGQSAGRSRPRWPPCPAGAPTRSWPLTRRGRGSCRCQRPLRLPARSAGRRSSGCWWSE